MALSEDGDIGYGSAVRVHDGITPKPGGWFELGKVNNISPPNEQVDQVERTHMKSPNRTKQYVAGLKDPGDMTVGINYLPGNDTDTYIIEWRKTNENREVEIGYAESLVADSFEGFPLGFAPGGLDASGLMTADLNLKVAGAVTRIERAEGF